jgi:hypothetical protein
VPSDNFERECDRLSQIVDGPQFERLRWDRNEGPMLINFVALARSALEQRSEFELAEESSTTAIKRFVLKIHGNRIIAISIWIEDGLAHVGAQQIDRSHYRLVAGEPLTVESGAVDQQWMANALQELFGRVRN